MVEKLEAKGYDIVSKKEGKLAGVFNGSDVEIQVITNNDKVYRIAILDDFL